MLLFHNNVHAGTLSYYPHVKIAKNFFGYQWLSMKGININCMVIPVCILLKE